MQALLPLIITFGLMWALLIRPQQRRVRQHQELVATLAPGDEVITTGGIVGTIVALVDDIITLEVAPGTSIKVLRSAIQTRIAGYGEDPDGEDPDDDDDSADDDSADDDSADDDGPEDDGLFDEAQFDAEPVAEPAPEPAATAGDISYIPPAEPPPVIVPPTNDPQVTEPPSTEEKA